MKIEDFALERIQSLYENEVELNLSDSGVHPYSLKTLLTPEEIAELLEIEIGYGWTNGSDALRETIAALYPGRRPDEVILTNGSAEANFLVASSLLDEGDEAVVLTPNYLQIVGWARALGVDVKTSMLRATEGWRPDFDEIASLVTPKTRLISICNPNNPTGAELSRADMDALVDIARRHDLYLHADEVYKGSELEGDEPPSFADLYEKAIATNGLSKTMALPGLRIGWLVGPAQEIYDFWRYKDYTSITTGALSEHIANLVLEPARRRRILDRGKAHLRDNLALLADWIAANQRFSLEPPRAGGMAFVRYDAPVNSTELAHAIREAKSVLVVPGDVYGLDGYLRFGIGAERATLRSGLDRITEYMRNFD